MATNLGRKRETHGSETERDKEMLGTEVEFEHTYIVQASASDDYSNIISAGGIPLLRSTYGNAVCTQKHAEEIEYRLWEVRCTYSTLGSQEGGNGSGQGLNAIDISWSVEEREEVVTYDTEVNDPDTSKKKPIVNSVGERLITSINRPIPVLTIRRLELGWSAQRILDYSGKINDAEFYGAPKKCALMFGPTATRKEVEGLSLWEVTYIIKFNLLKEPATNQPRGWKRFLLNQGTKYRKVKDGPIVPYLKDGVPTTCNLDSEGLLLPENRNPIYAIFNVYETADFSELNLGP